MFHFVPSQTMRLPDSNKVPEPTPDTEDTTQALPFQKAISPSVVAVGKPEEPPTRLATSFMDFHSTLEPLPSDTRNAPFLVV
jgi:hypothetical protein